MMEKIVVRTSILLNPNEMDFLRRSILKQAEDGIIVVPPYCEILYPDEKILEQIRTEIENQTIDAKNGMISIGCVMAILDKYAGKENE